MKAVRMELVHDTTALPKGDPLVGYIEEMLLELADLASRGGETALAASLAIAAVQAGSRREAIAVSRGVSRG